MNSLTLVLYHLRHHIVLYSFITILEAVSPSPLWWKDHCRTSLCSTIRNILITPRLYTSTASVYPCGSYANISLCMRNSFFIVVFNPLLRMEQLYPPSVFSFWRKTSQDILFFSHTIFSSLCPTTCAWVCQYPTRRYMRYSRWGLTGASFNLISALLYH